MRDEGVNLNELVDNLVKYKAFMTPAMVETIKAVYGTASKKSFGAEFDLLEEVHQQIKAVRGLRSSAIGSDGAVLTNSKEAKEALTASTSLLKLLVDLQQDIVNISRMRAVEEATGEVLKEMDEGLQEKFLQALERKLEHAL